MKRQTIALVVLLALVAGFGGGELATRLAKPEAASTQRESVYDRIMRTGVIRCGYAVWDPGFTKDPNTGAFGGIVYDVTIKLGEMLGLKIDYVSELNVATYLEDMNAGKFDVECSGGFPNAQRGKFVLYSRPYGYAPTYAYVRADDTRFDSGLASINRPDVTVAVMDGDFSVHYREHEFPLTKTYQLSASMNFSDIPMAVVYGKADVAIFDAMSAKEVIASNPGKLRRLPFEIRTVPINFSVPRDESMLKFMIDSALDELVDSGYVTRLIRKYGFEDGLVLPVAPGHQSVQAK
ncbi:MAG: transporter substrate-binding domain-containing protein [Alphaproteobacteria bacterium]|nr:transporter substrate-binding domain-containing protein [Alphaproteobacteria bacterium]